MSDNSIRHGDGGEGVRNPAEHPEFIAGEAAHDALELERVRQAMGNGADDSRWRPGETAVDALIRERDELRAELAQAEQERDTARAAVGNVSAGAVSVMRERDELRASLARVRDYLNAHAHQQDGVAWSASRMIDRALGVKP